MPYPCARGLTAPRRGPPYWPSVPWGDRADPVIRAYLATPVSGSHTRRAGSKPDTFGPDFLARRVHCPRLQEDPGVARFFRALRAGDMTAVRAAFAPDAAWTLRGELPASGMWTGPGGIIDGFFPQIFGARPSTRIPRLLGGPMVRSAAGDRPPAVIRPSRRFPPQPIAGVDRVQGNGHYAGKRRQEQLVADGPIGATIVRARWTAPRARKKNGEQDQVQPDPGSRDGEPPGPGWLKLPGRGRARSGGAR